VFQLSYFKIKTYYDKQAYTRAKSNRSRGKRYRKDDFYVIIVRTFTTETGLLIGKKKDLMPQIKKH
jgi:hypothetical protein